MSILRKRTAPAAPSIQIVERTTYFRVIDGQAWQRVIIRDADGVLRRAYLRPTD